MKKLLYITLVTFLLSQSCNSSENEINNTILDNHKIININTIQTENDFSKFYTDSLIKNVEFVSLETKDESLIKQILRVRFSPKYIYIQNYLDNILVFERNGIFVRQIGKKGRGPGEYKNIFNFIVKNDTIIVLSGFKMLFYREEDGAFLKSIDYYNECNIFADGFCYFDDNNYYLWVSDPVGRVPSINTEFNIKEFSHLYKVVNGMVTNEYIKGITTERNTQRILYNGESYLLSPTRFDNYVYQINRDNIMKKYKINYFNKNIDQSNYPVGLSDKEIDELKNKLNNSGRYYSYGTFCENSDYCFIPFIGGSKFYCSIWNKETGKSISWRYAEDGLKIDKKIPLYFRTVDPFTDRFISILSYKDIKNLKDHTDGVLSESKLISSDDILKIRKIQETSNSIILFIELNS